MWVIPLAGSVIEVFSTGTSNYTIRITTPSTSGGASGAVLNSEFIYTSTAITIAQHGVVITVLKINQRLQRWRPCLKWKCGFGYETENNENMGGIV